MHTRRHPHTKLASMCEKVYAYVQNIYIQVVIYTWWGDGQGGVNSGYVIEIESVFYGIVM